MEVEPIITREVFPYIMSREFYIYILKIKKICLKETYPQILGIVK